MQLKSPAKINLFLRVMGKRADGYHELASLFQAVDLFDTLTFTLTDEDKFTCTDPSLSLDSSNLVIKARELFRQVTGLSSPVRIHLEKNIPMQAGLGGGSSNAATVLWGLNALHDLPFTNAQLQSLSAQLGSDVPFFFSSGTAYCTGRGEHVRDLPPLTLPTLSLIKTPYALPTPAVYGALNMAECSSSNPEELLASFYAGASRYINDLELPAFRLCRELAQLKEKQKGTCFMTGSGSALVVEGKGECPLRPLQRHLKNWY